MSKLPNSLFVLIYTKNNHEFHVCCLTFNSAMKVFESLEGIYRAEIHHKGKVFNVGRGKP